MKTIIRLISLLMTAMAALSCMDELADASQEETSSGEKVEMTFSASFDGDTRTTLVNGTEVWWLPGERIEVNGDMFWTTIDEAASSTEFTGETELADTYCAVSTYSLTEWSDGECYLDFSWWQWAAKDNLPVFLSAAKCDDVNGTFHFKNLLGYVKFTVIEEFSPIVSVEVQSNGGEAIALNTSKIDFSGVEPVLVDVEDQFPSDMITLASESGMDPGNYYIAIAPGTFSKGLRFVFRTADDRVVVKNINKEITLDRGVIQNIGEIRMSENHQERIALERQALIDFYNAAGGDEWYDNTNWLSDRPVGDWSGVCVDEVGYVTGLEFYGNNLAFEDLPTSMANLENLKTLLLIDGNFAKIPDVIRELKGLRHFAVSGGAYTPLECEIPEWIGEMTNLRTLSLGGDFPEIPEQITKLVQLEQLGISGPWNCGGDLGKSLPDLSGLVNLKELHILYYKLGIEIPDWIYDMHSLETLCLNNLELTGEISERISDLTDLKSLELRMNKLEGNIPEGITGLLKLEYLRLDENNLSGTVPEGFSKLHNLVSLALFGNRLSGYLPSDFEQNPNYELWGVDQNVLLQQSGYVLLPSSEVYESSDFTKDGEVMVLQRAIVGDGVDIVLLGDGFVDKDMSDGGKYDQAMQEALGYMFSLEPMKSYRDYFNVYTVRAVSRHDRFAGGYETALESYLGVPPFVNGNFDKAIEYALKAPVASDDDLTVAVILNVNAYAGTTSMDMSDDKAVAYVGMARDAFGFYSNSYEATFIHEVVGHAFAKLGDEYVYLNEAYPLSGDLDWRNQVWIDTGYSANLDITSDPEQIRWAHMLKDERYSSYTGIVEGGDYFAYGIWRPEENSMMRNNDPYFNAPSREAIVKRIMKLAGEEYSFEKFAAKDIHNPLPYTRANYVEQPFEPTAPPVIINGSWRDAVKN